MKGSKNPNLGPEVSDLATRMRRDPDLLDRARDASAREETALYGRMGKETGLDNEEAAVASEVAVAVAVSELTAEKVRGLLASPHGRQVMRSILSTA